MRLFCLLFVTASTNRPAWDISKTVVVVSGMKRVRTEPFCAKH